MATALDTQVDFDFDVNLEDFGEFECDIEEAEAVADLVTLTLSDDDCSVGLADGNATESQITGTGTDSCVENIATTNANSCPKCEKVYKRNRALMKHISVCEGVPGKKRKLPKYKQSFEEKFQLLDPPSLVADAILEKSESRILGVVRNSKGWHTKQLAKKLVAKSWTEPKLAECALAIVKIVAKCIHKVQEGHCSQAAGLEAYAELLSAAVDDSLISQWTCAIKIYAPTYNELICNNLLQHVMDDIVPVVVRKFKNLDERTAETTPAPEDLTADEKAVLHYAIGYVARRLVQKYSKVDNKAGQLFLQVVKTWTDPVSKSNAGTDTVLSEEVTSWTSTQDRGGLIHCAPKFYHFMKAVEIKTRSLLNVQVLPTFAGRNIIHIVAADLKSSPDILKEYNTLIGCDIIDEKLCEALLNEILMTWVATKARQTVKKFIFVKRTAKDSKASRMSTPALRKTLDKH